MSENINTDDLITAATRLIVIIGDPIEQSISPAVHNLAYRAAGLAGQCVYLACRVKEADLSVVIGAMRAMHWHGLTCTIPHKTGILPLLDELDPVAQKIGAVNTIVNRSGRLFGYNTDYLGIVRPLITACSTLRGKRCLVLGAGGTARAAIIGLAELGADVVVVNRTLQKAEQLVREFASEFTISCRDTANLVELSKGVDIIVNTTSVGMGELQGQTPCPRAAIRPGQIVLDAIYKPFKTELLSIAEEQGAIIIPGARMFLEQALAQYQIYTELEPPRAVMEQAICRSLGVKELEGTR